MQSSNLFWPDLSIAFGTLDTFPPAHFPQDWGAGGAGFFLPAVQPAFLVLLLSLTSLTSPHCSVQASDFEPLLFSSDTPFPGDLDHFKIPCTYR